MMKRIVGSKSRQRKRDFFDVMLENSGFDFLFDRIRKLHPFVREEFDAVVLIRIVRSGDDDADVKIILANEASDARCGENSGGGNRSAAVYEARSDDGGNVRTGFAGVRADERVGRSMIAMKILSDRTAERKESSVIKGRSPGDAADTVGAKKLSRHSLRGRRGQADKKFSTAVGESRGGERRLC
jgi:hypothetical protein